MVHATRGPCCTSLAEANDKPLPCLVFPIVTMSRSTYVLKGLSSVVCGKACKDILSRCVRMVLTSVADIGVDIVGELGAGEAGFERVTRLRLSAIQRWLANTTLGRELPIGFICNKQMSNLECVLFRPTDEGAPFLFGEMLDCNNTPLDSCQQGLLLMLQVWHTWRNGPWRLLGLLGLCYSAEQGVVARWRHLSVFRGEVCGFPLDVVPLGVGATVC